MSMTITAILLLVVATVVMVGPIRRSLITQHAFRLFCKITPNMSQTEREALEAGTVWWDGELFSGRPDWNKLLELPYPELTDEEKAFIDGPTQQLCDLINDWKSCRETEDLSPEVWQFIKENRFFGIIIPREYGGLEFSAYAHSQIVMKIASRSVAAGVSVMVPNSLGPAELLLQYGTQAQKDQYLNRLAMGKEVPCFALTAPDAGSDAAAMPDNGVVCMSDFNGQQTLGIRLNWNKRYITLGPIATVLGLAFKLFDPDGLLKGDKELGITLALIPTNTPGVEIGLRHNPLNVPFQNGPNSGKDVFIPMDWIIGGRERIGQGWRMLMECLSTGRAISLPATSTGGGKAACRYTGAYARIRRQFRLPIGRFEGVEEALARIAGKTYQMDAARVMTLGALDQGESPSVPSAILKYHLTERYRQIINDAMDVQGGSGIILGPSNLIGPAYLAIPVAITVEGANILTRSMIIFGQGAIRCHPYVLRELKAAQNESFKDGLKDFDKALIGHVGFTIGNTIRTLFLGLTRGRLSRVPAGHPKEARYYQQLNWLSAAFALTADMAMLSMGGALKRKEKLSARLGDVLSELYLASAVLKRFHEQGKQHDDVPLMRWALHDSLYNIQEALTGVHRNLPNRPLAWFLRLITFPTGRCFTPPSDRQGQRVVQTIINPCAARDRLTEGIFQSTDPSEKVELLEMALRSVVQAEPAEKKIHTAQNNGKLKGLSGSDLVMQALHEGVITEEEAAGIMEAEHLRSQVIQVDSFSPESFGIKDSTTETSEPFPVLSEKMG